MAGTNYFTFNGKSTKDFNLLTNGLQTFGAPARVVQRLEVPGRNGDIIIDEGTYENYIQRYDLVLKGNAVVQARELANWLLSSKGYSKLTDTYNPDTFRMAAYYSSIGTVLDNLMENGTATIEFDCKPQRYLVSGDVPVDIDHTSVTLTNPTNFDALPLIHVFANESVSNQEFFINGMQVDIGTYEEVYIDCENMHSYFPTGTSASSYVYFDGGFYYPVFGGGEEITIDSTDAHIEVYPRWWRL